jgi:hypothetical protein
MPKQKLSKIVFLEKIFFGSSIYNYFVNKLCHIHICDEEVWLSGNIV